jgi:hypothetical protein
MPTTCWVVLARNASKLAFRHSFLAISTWDSWKTEIIFSRNKMALNLVGSFTRQIVEMPAQAAVHVHYLQNRPVMLMPSTTAGGEVEVSNMCMIPLMWVPYYIKGETPKATLDKIELLLVAVVPAFIQTWSQYA